MNWEALLQELKSGEGQTLEFKKSMGQQDKGLESLCGMLNADSARGTVLFGVAPDGSPGGIEEGDPDGAQRTLSQKMQKFDPPVRPVIEVIEHEGRRFISLTAERTRSVAYHEYDGRAFVREGTVTRQLTLSEKRALCARRERERHTGPWRCDRCGSVAGTLGGLALTVEGVKRSYACECGGEFWPIA